MVITNDFVFIHVPKNGGTFITKCILELYDKTTDKNRKRNIIDRLYYHLSRENTNYSNHYKSEALEDLGIKRVTQHQGCDEIPFKHKQKPIVSILRNPFDRYVSIYKFDWWGKHIAVSEKILNRNFPNFPNLSFKKYMDLLFNYKFSLFKERIGTNLDVGVYTFYYIKHFAKNYMDLLKNVQDISQLTDDDFYDVNFLHTEKINLELYEFLEKTGWPEKRIKFILTKGKVNASRASNSYRQYYDEELIDLIMEKDAFLFKRHPEYTF